MAEEIVQNNFQLPLTLPYYGPGGLPFIYPPLGFYIMAITTGVFQIPVFSYLRWAAPIFSLLSLIPLYAGVLVLTRSRISAAFCVFITAFSLPFYTYHVQSAGIVRALAFLAMNAGLFFLARAVRDNINRDYILAAICWGATLLTHWLYAEFFVVAAIVLGISRLQWKVFFKSFLMGLGGILLTLPWLGLMLNRYGSTFLSSAFQSHQNDYFLIIFNDLDKLTPWLIENTRYLTQTAWMVGLIILSVLYLIARGKLSLPILFGVVLIVLSESARFTVLLGAMMIAILITAIYTQITCRGENLRYQKISGALFLVLILFLLGWSGMQPISKIRPSISQSTLELADYMKASTQPESYFLNVVEIGEAEWFPFLFDRTPVMSSWGSEWIGTYTQQLELVSDIGTCAAFQDALCIEGFIRRLTIAPDYIITYTAATDLTSRIMARQQWKLVYQNDNYLLWQAVP